MFDKESVKALRVDINALLERFNVKHAKAHLKLGNASFDAKTVSFKLEAVVKSKDGSVQSIEEINFLKHAELYGLAKTDLGRTFMYQGREFRISGLNPRARKRPIFAMLGDSLYNFACEDIVKLLGKS